MSLSNKVLDIATIGGFLGCLCLPFITERLRGPTEDDSFVEFRKLAKEPKLPKRVSPSDSLWEVLGSAEGYEWMFTERGVRWMTRYPRRYDAFYSDKFGLRDWLLRSYSKFVWNVLGESPIDLAERGQDDWVFATASHELDFWRGAMPFSEAELSAWRRCLKQRREFFAKEGIEYIFCVAPHKEVVYPELMASWERQGENRVRQLQRYLGDEDVGLLYLADAMLKAKELDTEENNVYRRLGIHWTERGAKAGCDAIVDRLRLNWPDLPIIPLDEYKLVDGKLDLGDDMAGRLRLSDETVGVRREYDLELPGKRRWSSSEGELGELLTKNSVEGLPSAWVQHDSFGLELRGFLSESLGDVVYSHGIELKLERVLAAKPDVVIHMIYEPVMNTLPLLTFHKAGESGLASRFEESSEVVMRLSPADGFAGVSPNDRLYLHRSEEGLALDGRRIGIGLWLPEIGCPADHDLIYRTEISVEQEGWFRLAYSTRDEHEFEAHRSVGCHLKPGRNVLYLELLVPELAGRVFLSPGSSASSSVLHSLEVRAVPTGDKR